MTVTVPPDAVIVDPPNPDKFYCSRRIQHWQMVMRQHPEQTEKAREEIKRYERLMAGTDKVAPTLGKSG